LRRISFRNAHDRREEIPSRTEPALQADLFQAREIDDEAMTHTSS
jgi:hypothetical protein